MKRASKIKPLVVLWWFGSAFRVVLKVGHQEFLVGPEWDSEAEAQWFAKQLRAAMKKL